MKKWLEDASLTSGSCYSFFHVLLLSIQSGPSKRGFPTGPPNFSRDTMLMENPAVMSGSLAGKFQLRLGLNVSLDHVL